MIVRKLVALLIIFFITTQCFEETDNISTTPSVDGESQQQDEKKEQNLDESFPTIAKVPGTLASYAARIYVGPDFYDISFDILKSSPKNIAMSFCSKNAPFMHIYSSFVWSSCVGQVERYVNVQIAAVEKFVHPIVNLLDIYPENNQSYSLSDIFEDSLSFNISDLIVFRGPVLGDIWIDAEKKYDQEEEMCQILFRKTIDLGNSSWPPVRYPPDDMFEVYTMGERAEYHDWFHGSEQQEREHRPLEWSHDVIQKFLSAPSTCGPYTVPYCDVMLKKHRRLIYGKKGIVVGSLSPWAEAALLNLGAKEVTTIEYSSIIVDYPGLSARHPSDVAQSYSDGNWLTVDFAFSFSSLEHDGLGRYGDPLNPFGDLESLARIRCLIKPGGYLFLSIPLAPDALVWNAHRLYGKYRMALMLLGWTPLDLFPEVCDVKSKAASGNFMCQPLLLLQKPFT